MSERFLFLQFNKQSVLSFAEFYSVARKIYLQIRSTVNSTKVNRDDEEEGDSKPAAKLSETPEFLADLTEEERLLYHLLAATSPTLYQMRRVDEPTLLSPKKKKRQVWCLESVANRNRQQVFHDLLQQKTTAKAKCDAILGAIRQHRGESTVEQENKPKSAVAASPVAKPPLEVLAETGGTTVEERVRARAAVREREEGQRKAQDRETNGMDREWLVRLTDALWSQASNRMRSNVRFQPKALVRKSCSVSLKDAAAMLRASLSTGGASRAHIGIMGRGDKVSKRQIVEALLQLSQEFPDWITLSDGDSKESILRVKAVDYAEIRAKLTGTKAIPTSRPVAKPGHNSLLDPPQKQQQKKIVKKKLLTASNKGQEGAGRMGESSLAKERRAKKARLANKDMNAIAKDAKPAATKAQQTGKATKKRSATEQAPEPTGTRRKSPRTSASNVLRVSPNAADASKEAVVEPVRRKSPRLAKK